MAARHEGSDDVPSIREIGDLTRRLRELSAAGRNVDPAERAAFLADKDALIARIESATRRAGTSNDGPTAAAGLDGEPRPADSSATSHDDGEEWSR